MSLYVCLGHAVSNVSVLGSNCASMTETMIQIVGMQRKIGPHLSHILHWGIHRLIWGMHRFTQDGIRLMKALYCESAACMLQDKSPGSQKYEELSKVIPTQMSLPFDDQPKVFKAVWQI